MNNDHLTPLGSGREELRNITVCPLCRAAYYPLAPRIMVQRGKDHLLYLECRHCGSAVVAFVTAGAAGIDTYGVLTDLTSDELLEVVSHQAVSADDVINLHQWFHYHDAI